MSSEQVYNAVGWFISNHDYKLTNVFVHAWEADSFSVTSSSYTWEVEVKISRSDFFADFRKPKHAFMKNYRRGFGNLSSGEWCHDGARQTNFQQLKLSGDNCPNKFFYACPVGVIETHEIPKYAGLIYVMDSGSYRIIKQAPFLHKETFNYRKMLFDKYYYQYIDQKNKIYALEGEAQRLRNELELLKATSVMGVPTQ